MATTRAFTASQVLNGGSIVQISVDEVTAEANGSGVYSENVWMSIIFQIMFALLTLQVHNIYIDDFLTNSNSLFNCLTRSLIKSRWL